MSGEAALTKIKLRAKAWLTGQILSGVAIHIDRALDQPFQEAETPCVNLRIPFTQYSIQGYSSGHMHDAAIHFDLLSASMASATIDESQAEMAADIAARMGNLDAVPGNLGELLQAGSCEPISSGVQNDDFNLSDIGVVTLAYRLVWITPINDFRTIAGQNGLVP